MSDSSVDELWRIEFETEEASFRAKTRNPRRAHDARVARVDAALWFLPGRALRPTLEVAADTPGAASAGAFEAARAANERLGRQVVSTSITQSTSAEPPTGASRLRRRSAARH